MKNLMLFIVLLLLSHQGLASSVSTSDGLSFYSACLYTLLISFSAFILDLKTRYSHLLRLSFVSVSGVLGAISLFALANVFAFQAIAFMLLILFILIPVVYCVCVVLKNRGYQTY